MIDIHDGLRECLRSLLRQIVTAVICKFSGGCDAQLIDSVGHRHHVFLLFYGMLGKFRTSGSGEANSYLYTRLAGATVRGTANSLSAKR